MSEDGNKIIKTMSMKEVGEMKASSLIEGGIYEVSFGYNAEMGGYTTRMSDILMLYEIVGRSEGV